MENIKRFKTNFLNELDNGEIDLVLVKINCLNKNKNIESQEQLYTIYLICLLNQLNSKIPFNEKRSNLVKLINSLEENIELNFSKRGTNKISILNRCLNQLSFFISVELFKLDIDYFKIHKFEFVEAVVEDIVVRRKGEFDECEFSFIHEVYNGSLDALGVNNKELFTNYIRKYRVLSFINFRLQKNLEFKELLNKIYNIIYEWSDKYTDLGIKNLLFIVEELFKYGENDKAIIILQKSYFSCNIEKPDTISLIKIAELWFKNGFYKEGSDLLSNCIVDMDDHFSAKDNCNYYFGEMAKILANFDLIDESISLFSKFKDYLSDPWLDEDGVWQDEQCQYFFDYDNIFHTKLAVSEIFRKKEKFEPSLKLYNEALKVLDDSIVNDSFSFSFIDELYDLGYEQESIKYFNKFVQKLIANKNRNPSLSIYSEIYDSLGYLLRRNKLKDALLLLNLVKKYDLNSFDINMIFAKYYANITDNLSLVTILDESLPLLKNDQFTKQDIIKRIELAKYYFQAGCTKKANDILSNSYEKCLNQISILRSYRYSYGLNEVNACLNEISISLFRNMQIIETLEICKQITEKYNYISALNDILNEKVFNESAFSEKNNIYEQVFSAFFLSDYFEIELDNFQISKILLKLSFECNKNYPKSKNFNLFKESLFYFHEIESDYYKALGLLNYSNQFYDSNRFSIGNKFFMKVIINAKKLDPWFACSILVKIYDFVIRRNLNFSLDEIQNNITNKLPMIDDGNSGQFDGIYHKKYIVYDFVTMLTTNGKFEKAIFFLENSIACFDVKRRDYYYEEALCKIALSLVKINSEINALQLLDKISNQSILDEYLQEICLELVSQGNYFNLLNLVNKIENKDHACKLISIKLSESGEIDLSLKIARLIKFEMSLFETLSWISFELKKLGYIDKSQEVLIESNLIETRYYERFD